MAGMLPSAEGPAEGRLADFAFDYMLGLLLENVLQAGDNLSAEEVASRLGVSRYPVMEAMKRLEREGFIRIVPQVGCLVVDADPREISDFYTVFARFEGEIAAWAAVRRTTDEVTELDAIADELEAYLGDRHTPDQNARAYRALNRAYHLQIHRMARSGIVSAMALSYWDRSDFYIGTVRGSRIFAERIRTAHDEHEAVRQAIRAGDARAARRAMEAHIRETGRSVAAKRGRDR